MGFAFNNVAFVGAAAAAAADVPGDPIPTFLKYDLGSQITTLENELIGDVASLNGGPTLQADGTYKSLFTKLDASGNKYAYLDQFDGATSHNASATPYNMANGFVVAFDLHHIEPYVSTRILARLGGCDIAITATNHEHPGYLQVGGVAVGPGPVTSDPDAGRHTVVIWIPPSGSVQVYVNDSLADGSLPNPGLSNGTTPIFFGTISSGSPMIGAAITRFGFEQRGTCDGDYAHSIYEWLQSGAATVVPVRRLRADGHCFMGLGGTGSIGTTEGDAILSVSDDYTAEINNGATSLLYLGDSTGLLFNTTGISVSSPPAPFNLNNAKFFTFQTRFQLGDVSAVQLLRQGAGADELRIYTDGGGNIFASISMPGGGSTHTVINSTGALQTGAVYNLILTFNGDEANDALRLRMWLNGAEQTLAITTGTIAPNAMPSLNGQTFLHFTDTASCSWYFLKTRYEALTEHAALRLSVEPGMPAIAAPTGDEIHEWPEEDIGFDIVVDNSNEGGLATLDITWSTGTMTVPSMPHLTTIIDTAGHLRVNGEYGFIQSELLDQLSLNLPVGGDSLILLRFWNSINQEIRGGYTAKTRYVRTAFLNFGGGADNNPATQVNDPALPCATLPFALGALYTNFGVNPCKIVLQNNYMDGMDASGMSLDHAALLQVGTIFYGQSHTVGPLTLPRLTGGGYSLQFESITIGELFCLNTSPGAVSFGTISGGDADAPATIGVLNLQGDSEGDPGNVGDDGPTTTTGEDHSAEPNVPGGNASANAMDGASGGAGDSAWSNLTLLGTINISQLNGFGKGGGTGGGGGVAGTAIGGRGGPGSDGFDDGMGTPSDGLDGASGGNATANGGHGGFGGVGGNGMAVQYGPNVSISNATLNEGGGGTGGTGGMHGDATGGEGGPGGSGVNGGNNGGTGATGSTEESDGIDRSGTTASSGAPGSLSPI